MLGRPTRRCSSAIRRCSPDRRRAASRRSISAREWTAMTGLPFVWAFWRAAPDAADAEVVALLQDAAATGMRACRRGRRRLLSRRSGAAAPWRALPARQSDVRAHDPRARRPRDVLSGGGLARPDRHRRAGSSSSERMEGGMDRARSWQHSSTSTTGRATAMLERRRAALDAEQYTQGPRQQLQVRPRHARAHLLGRVGLAHPLDGHVADDADSVRGLSRSRRAVAPRGARSKPSIARSLVGRGSRSGDCARDRLPSAQRPARPVGVLAHGAARRESRHYHRGQVTTMLRQLGAQPPKSTDLIAYYRERASRRS